MTKTTGSIIETTDSITKTIESVISIHLHNSFIPDVEPFIEGSNHLHLHSPSHSSCLFVVLSSAVAPYVHPVQATPTTPPASATPSIPSTGSTRRRRATHLMDLKGIFEFG
ncbi:hypothetical protein RHMOL_Rhmol08G0232300 [Rhododendron molle]|uniref:Uncharacterized protein n=1 Tax=Rhododendron molle TaxID=49168 RepID=A0ACC0MSK5_RHOML|nr:hypothetical protein RHMOL_Rhmol08G0232300 [Rhododendron molle]